MQIICFEKTQFRRGAVFVIFCNGKFTLQQKLVRRSRWNHGHALHCTKKVPYSFPSGSGSHIWPLFTYKLWQQKVRQPVVKIDVASVLKPDASIRRVKKQDYGEPQKTVRIEKFSDCVREGGMWRTHPARARNVGCRVFSPLCMTRNMGGFIPERGGGREGEKGITENPCFPHEGQCQGTTCLRQENWAGTERDLEGKGRRGSRGCKKQPGLTSGVTLLR